MKPFDLEAAKNGAPIMTRDGRKARIVCFDRKDKSHPLVVLIEDEGSSDAVHVYTTEGWFWNANNPSQGDLCMAPVNRSGWINIYQRRNSDGGADYRGWGGVIHDTREEALADRGVPDAITVQIEWTE